MANNNTSQFCLKKREPKDKQMILRYDNTPLYSLDKIHVLDWKALMWFASLENAENYVSLFIVIWDAIDGTEFSIREYKEEITRMIQIFENLRTNNTNYLNCSKILTEYKNCRCNNNNTELRKILVNNAWAEIESCGFRNYSYALSDQLGRCSYNQKKHLRNMVLSRVRSFQSFARQIKEGVEVKKSQQQVVLDNKTRNDNQVIETLLEEIESLKNQVVILTEKNSQVVSLDDDMSSKKNLISDIHELIDMLSDFTMIQGSNYKINDETVTSLLRTYECQVDYPSKRSKLVLGYILQYFAITTIIKEFRQYIQFARSCGEIDPTLESDIINVTENLIKYTELFSNNRKGEDGITNITPIKIRQYVYSALSRRGLSDDHPLIKEIANKLMNEMNEFRLVLDEDINDELNDQAIQITHRVINIFCFRLKTQAFELTYQFFKAGQDVDPLLMQGTFRNDDIRKLEVEVCGFPCIGILDCDKPNQKVFTKAQVITRSKKDYYTGDRYIVYSMK
jgi:hypothetical protein